MKLPPAFLEACERTGYPPTEHCLYVSVAKQTMVHHTGSHQRTLTVSTAINGTGQLEGSFQTPLVYTALVKKSGKVNPLAPCSRAAFLSGAMAKAIQPL